jgi:hypothetical protein
MGTFGPGALVDLVDDAVVVAGLGWWAKGEPEIHEERLVAMLARQEGFERRCASTRRPPARRTGSPSDRRWIQAFELPAVVHLPERVVLGRLRPRARVTGTAPAASFTRATSTAAGTAARARARRGPSPRAARALRAGVPLRPPRRPRLEHALVHGRNEQAAPRPRPDVLDRRGRHLGGPRRRAGELRLRQEPAHVRRRRAVVLRERRRSGGADGKPPVARRRARRGAANRASP